MFIEHPLYSRAILGTKVIAVFKTTFLMSRGFRSDKEIDRGQVNRYTMCPVVMRSMGVKEIE